MADVDRYVPGDFCWPELATTDSAAAKRFYSSLFGWDMDDVPAGPDMTYTMCRLRGKEAGALFQMGPQQEGMPPHWSAYVTVASADDAAGRARQAGGRILMEPFDVMDVGRTAVIGDPEGAAFAVWEPKRHVGATVREEPGAFCWHELTTRRMEAAKAFYGSLFGWRFLDSGVPGYASVENSGHPQGGLMDATSFPPEIPSVWTVYFQVESCDAAAKKALELGASAIVPPRDVPNVGRFAVLRDPQGAVFSIIAMKAP